MADEVDEAQEMADAANIEVTETNNFNDKENNMDLEKIQKALGIEGEVTEDEIIERFSEVSTELAHVKNEREQANGRITGLEEALEAFKEKVGKMEEQRFSEKVDAVIAKAMRENKLTKEKAEKFKNLINEENFVQMSELIDSMPEMQVFKEAGSSVDKVSGNQAFFAEVDRVRAERKCSYRQAIDVVEKEGKVAFDEKENEIPFKASEVRELFKDDK
jgi:phage I-like protein